MTHATLGGELLLVDFGPIGWTYAAGPQPHMRAFPLERTAAERLLERSVGGEHLELAVDSPGYALQRVQRLRLLSLGASNRPQVALALVADRRWELPRIAVNRSYNIRSKTGEKKLLQDGGEPDQLAEIVDRDHFRPWTLYPRDAPTSAWTAKQVLEDVLELVSPGAWRFENTFTRMLDVSAEGGLRLKGSADAVLGQALALIPGANVYVDDAGSYVVYDQRSGAERGVVERAGPPIFGPRLTAMADLRVSRPREFEVHFRRAIEIRVDNRQEGSSQDDEQQSVVAGGPDPEDVREIVNISEVEDFQLTMSDGRVLPMTSLADIDELLDAYALSANAIAGQTLLLSHDLIRTHWFNPSVLQAQIDTGGQEPDPVLAARFAGILRDYRQRWRIATVFMARIAALSAARVAIRDDAKKSRARAPVYCDWTQLYKQRAKLTTPGGYRTGDRFRGYAERLEDGQIAPAIVSIEDDELGILRVAITLDPQGQISQIAPGYSEGPGAGGEMPVADVRELAKAGRGRGVLTSDLHLTDDFRIAIVLTMTPGAPNDERALHVERVSAADAFRHLGVPELPCAGPTWKLLCDLDEARFAHSDDRLAAVDEVLGLNGGAAGNGDALGDPINKDRVRALALGAAAAQIARFLDRPEGELNVAMQPHIRPVGSISAVTHEIAPGGATTHIDLPSELDTEDVLTQLNESLRQKILGLPDANTGPNP